VQRADANFLRAAYNTFGTEALASQSSQQSAGSGFDGCADYAEVALADKSSKSGFLLFTLGMVVCAWFNKGARLRRQRAQS
jgi:hypothetical protein